MAKVEIKSMHKLFGGELYRCQHISKVLGNLMASFSIYIPSSAIAAPEIHVPQIYFLSGLTCSDENFATKSAAFEKADRLSIAIIMPDTSPRGANLVGENDDWDFGSGASFYVNATEIPWNQHYRMYDYILNELPEFVEDEFPVHPSKKSIMGHSMGGHGALVLGLKNPTVFKSISAFAPICNPMQCPWGVKAFSGYLGDNDQKWDAYDATEILKKNYDKMNLPPPLFIDQGDQDSFLINNPNQLLPDNLIAVCKSKEIPLIFKLREGYDHSYYFISTFIQEHLEFHSQYLFE